VILRNGISSFNLAPLTAAISAHDCHPAAPRAGCRMRAYRANVPGTMALTGMPSGTLASTSTSPIEALTVLGSVTGSRTAGFDITPPCAGTR
jgi:hypothetical protein